WDAATGAPVTAWGERGSGVDSLTFTFDGSQFLTCGNVQVRGSFPIRVWDAATGILAEEIPGTFHVGAISASMLRPVVNEKFAEEMASEARVKVTAPKDLVRNRMARPDDWENRVIEEKFRSGDWPIGEAFYEQTSVDGKPAFRMLIPEYYSDSCLACHGSPAGETDVTGFPKEGGSLGDLAGAISITLFE
ncbi:MAG: DUF3365 domain-containing protein, partial [Rhodobacteraceae bacterium]|nr:DUF3365 domain-containing protein [Paracoccaceae bacterium]